MGTKPGAGKGLRIATGCSTLDEFTAVFRKFCTPNSIFIATRSPRESGFDITAASEVMAMLCLAQDREDLFPDSEAPVPLTALAFALSFDDFVLSFFTTGESPQPLPVLRQTPSTS